MRWKELWGRMFRRDILKGNQGSWGRRDTMMMIEKILRIWGKRRVLGSIRVRRLLCRNRGRLWIRRGIRLWIRLGCRARRVKRYEEWSWRRCSGRRSLRRMLWGLRLRKKYRKKIDEDKKWSESKLRRIKPGKRKLKWRRKNSLRSKSEIKRLKIKNFLKNKSSRSLRNKNSLSFNSKKNLKSKRNFNLKNK